MTGVYTRSTCRRRARRSRRSRCNTYNLPARPLYALGATFDQRAFHDAILAIGSVPLPLLEERMKQFIADGGVNPPAGR